MGRTTVQRRDYLRTLLAEARHEGGDGAPWRGGGSGGVPNPAGVIGAAALYFDDEGDLLVELHREWLRLLLGRLHRGEIVARRSVANVRDLYDEVCREHPTLRGLLDSSDANPALWEPTAREHAMLARIAGLVPDGTPMEDAADLGRVLVTQRVPAQRGAFRRTGAEAVSHTA